MGYIYLHTHIFFLDFSNGKYLERQIMYKIIYTFDYKLGKYEETTVFKT